MGVAGGATRTALIQHQARRDNMADVAAKDGSQVSELRSTIRGIGQLPVYTVHKTSVPLHACSQWYGSLMYINVMYFSLPQETLVNLAALLVGLVLTPAVAGWMEYVIN